MRKPKKRIEPEFRSKEFVFDNNNKNFEYKFTVLGRRKSHGEGMGKKMDVFFLNISEFKLYK